MKYTSPISTSICLINCICDIAFQKTAEEFLSKEDYLGKTIIVSDIPDGINETKVLLYFQKKSNGGGEVGRVKLFTEYRTALVVFEEAQGKK